MTVTWPSHSSVTRGVLRWAGFSSSVTPHKTTVRFLDDPFATRQLQDLRLGELRQRIEIIRVEIFFDRKPGVLDPRDDGVGGAGRQLQFRQSQQELHAGLIGRGGVRANVANSRPIVGSRNCRNWVLSNSVVTSTISTFLSNHRFQGWDQVKNHTDRTIGAGPLSS